MIDAYAHCGVSNYLPVERLRSVMDGAGVRRAVLCQHLGEYDNRYLESVVRSEPDRFTAVALVDGARADWQWSLAEVAASPAFRGLRIADEMFTENPALAAEAAALGLVIVAYLPNGAAPAIGAIRSLVAARPNATVQISHLGNPRVAGGGVVSGFELLELANEPRVVVALSGLHMFCAYPHRELDELIVALRESFGPDRLMWGSNFPVGGSAPSRYTRDADMLASGRWGFDEASVELATEINARRLWFDGRPA